MPLAWLRAFDEFRKLAPRQRHIDLATVRRICGECGMPHPGMSLELEIETMLGFFHALNALLWCAARPACAHRRRSIPATRPALVPPPQRVARLQCMAYAHERGHPSARRYDTPELRDLVVLDPQWVIDAACSVIRAYEQEDHTKKYARMRALDEEAIRKDPDAWAALTKGKAILRQPLLDILWRQDEFEEHKRELRDLMVRFGLFVPLPGKQDAAGHHERGNAWLVPTLLRDASSEPSGWPATPQDAARLRIHFTHEGFAAYPLVSDAGDLRAGFLPIGAFHRLCAAALGSSRPPTGGEELALFRNHAYVNLGQELVVLRFVAAESSVVVQLFNAGRKGSGALVLDRLRVMLSTELAVYQNLRWRILAPLRDAPGKWVDLDQLSTATTAPTLAVGGAPLELDALKRAFSWWFTTQCEFNLVHAHLLRDASAAVFPKMLPLQEMRVKHPDWLVKKTLDFHGVCSRAYADEYLAVSHRWELPGDPDPERVQLDSLQTYLKTKPRIKYVFYDFLCLAQVRRGRTAAWGGGVA